MLPTLPPLGRSNYTRTGSRSGSGRAAVGRQARRFPGACTKGHSGGDGSRARGGVANRGENIVFEKLLGNFAYTGGIVKRWRVEEGEVKDTYMAHVSGCARKYLGTCTTQRSCYLGEHCGCVENKTWRCTDKCGFRPRQLLASNYRAGYLLRFHASSRMLPPDAYTPDSMSTRPTDTQH